MPHFVFADEAHVACLLCHELALGSGQGMLQALDLHAFVLIGVSLSYQGEHHDHGYENEPCVAAEEVDRDGATLAQHVDHVSVGGSAFASGGFLPRFGFIIDGSQCVLNCVINVKRVMSG